MFLAIIFLIVPTALAAILLRDYLICFKSSSLRLAASWFVGQFVTSWGVFLGACALNFFSFDHTLRETALLVLALLSAYLAWQLIVLFRSGALVKVRPSEEMLRVFSLIFLFGLFSFFFYRPHLITIDSVILRSPIYWDFNVHFPIIQNFVYGDNFPPQNESFSGTPLTYHFFFDFMTSINASLGLDLVEGINFTSIEAFTVMLLGLFGLAEELFAAPLIGWCAVGLGLTSGSLRFLSYFIEVKNKSFFQKIVRIFTNRTHPALASTVPGNPAGYNGGMFNMFYFVVERQMTLAVIFLLLTTAVLYRAEKLTWKIAAPIGLVIGFFFQWHLFATVAVNCALMYFLIFGRERRTVFLMLSISAAITALHVLYFRNIMRPEWFAIDLSRFPRFNPHFPTRAEGDYPLSLSHAVMYYVYAYGFKIVLLAVALRLTFLRNRNAFWALTAVIVPSFILVNTVQLSPLTIYDNHKWLRPMNMVMDIACAYPIGLLFGSSAIRAKLLGCVVFPFVTLSGLMELTPFLNSKPYIEYATYPSKTTMVIRSSTRPKGSFLSLHSLDIHLAGRKLFIGNPEDEPGTSGVVESFRFNTFPRYLVMSQIYSAKSIAAFCLNALANNIDYVEFDFTRKSFEIFNLLHPFDRIKTDGDAENSITFIDVNEVCIRK